MFWFIAAAALAALISFLYPVFSRNAGGTDYVPHHVLLNYGLPVCGALASHGYAVQAQLGVLAAWILPGAVGAACFLLLYRPTTAFPNFGWAIKPAALMFFAWPIGCLVFAVFGFFGTQRFWRE